MTKPLEALISSEIADFFSCFVEIHTELGGPNTVEEAQWQLTERVTRIASECEAALIAALEQSEKQRESWEQIAQTNISEREKDIAELEAARKRVAELETSHSQVIQARDHYKSLVSASQLAVKLDSDKVPDPAVHAYDGENFYIAGWNARGKADREKLRAAGITVQGDE